MLVGKGRMTRGVGLNVTRVRVEELEWEELAVLSVMGMVVGVPVREEGGAGNDAIVVLAVLELEVTRTELLGVLEVEVREVAIFVAEV